MKNYPPDTWTGFWLVVDADDKERKYGVVKGLVDGDAVMMHRGWVKTVGKRNTTTIPIQESEYTSYIAFGLFPELEVVTGDFVTIYGQRTGENNPKALKIVMPPPPPPTEETQ